MASTREQHMRPLVPDDLDALSRIHVAACRVAYRFMDWDYSWAEVRDWYDRREKVATSGPRAQSPPRSRPR